MSRSAFAARFTELVGEPAMHYLTRWKMHAALSVAHARTTRRWVSSLASLGYESEAAFSRAFKRVMGTTPGAARRQARAKSSSRRYGMADSLSAVP